MRFVAFALALYITGVVAVDKTMFEGRYTQAFWREAGKQVRWADHEVRNWLDRIGIL